MLLILMYHRVHDLGTHPRALRQHLAYLRDHHPIVWPGERLPAGELSVCLTFDDATADFYLEVFPLLAELEMRALVAVPTGFIENDTEVPAGQRLLAQRTADMSGTYAVADSPLCTWRELRAMQASGHVLCTSHGHTHACMTDDDTDLSSELDLSARTLEEHLERVPDTFIYPYGRTNRQVQKSVAARYRYAMRIGTAMNRNWGGAGDLLYRVDAEAFWPEGKTWSFTQAVKYRLKYLGNRLRGI